MVAHRKARPRKHSKGQSDHVDAWLMSYADMITLLFMLFVIFVSVSIAKNHQQTPFSRDEPEHPYHVSDHSGLVTLVTPYDETSRILGSLIYSNSADQNIAVEQTDHGIWVDMLASPFFENGSADIPADQLPLLHSIARVLKETLPADSAIEVEGYTSNEPLEHSKFSNNWELSAMRAARIVNLLIEEGIDPTRLRATSYAANHPLVPNNDAAGNPIDQNRARNERITIKVDIAPPAEKL